MGGLHARFGFPSVRTADQAALALALRFFLPAFAPLRAAAWTEGARCVLSRPPGAFPLPGPGEAALSGLQVPGLSAPARAEARDFEQDPPEPSLTLDGVAFEAAGGRRPIVPRRAPSGRQCGSPDRFCLAA